MNLDYQSFKILLIVVTVLLPIIPSFIMFKFLPKSDASGEGPFKGMKIKFGGAFAGYFIIFICMVGVIETNRFFDPPVSAPYSPYEVWHVTGQATLEDGEQLFPADIAINPPTVNVSPGGTFNLDLPVLKKEGNVLNFPIFSVRHNGFNIVDIPLGDNTITPLGRLPVQIEKNVASKTIRIQNFKLMRMAPYQQGGANEN